MASRETRPVAVPQRSRLLGIRRAVGADPETRGASRG